MDDVRRSDVDVDILVVTVKSKILFHRQDSNPHPLKLDVGKILSNYCATTKLPCFNLFN